MVEKKEPIEEGKLSIEFKEETIRHLSIGLYRNFARAVKEIISNSYDGGATEVTIKLDLDNFRIVIRDNGRGMTLNEIKKNFLTVGNVTTPSDKVDELGRKRIGTFGIGCVSIFPYCNELEVITKKKGSDKLIETLIPTGRYFKDGRLSLTRRDIIHYKVLTSDLPKDKGETIFVLKDIKPHIIEDLKNKGFTGETSIDKFGGYDKFKWTLCQYGPIQFPKERKDLQVFFEDKKTVSMSLWLDGEELFRNVPENAIILEKDEKTIGNISFKYVIMTTMEPVKPKESKGIQVRLKDVAIALPRDFDVTKETGKVPGKFNWMCGEVHITNGLDSALLIDRDSFSYTQEVADFEDFFRKLIIKWNSRLENLAKKDKEIYESLIGLEKSKKIMEDLQKSGIVQISEKRVRLPKKPIKKVSSKRIIDTLSRQKKYEVESKSDIVSERKKPIEIDEKKKSIIVHIKHPDFIETFNIGRKKFKVRYEEWATQKSVYSICKLEKDNQVVYNKSHPIFKNDINQDEIKRLSLGILLILKDVRNKEKLIKEFNRLLEDTFMG